MTVETGSEMTTETGSEMTTGTGTFMTVETDPTMTLETVTGAGHLLEIGLSHLEPVAMNATIVANRDTL